MRPQMAHSLRPWLTDLLLLGVNQTMVVIAPRSSIFCSKCSKFEPPQSAFAAILADGSVVTWGKSKSGGDSSTVQDQLKDVRQIQGTASSFAAILANGSVVSWGNKHHGGDSSQVQHQLTDVLQIHATEAAFAAILADGSVVTWGSPSCGGESSARSQDQLRNVQILQQV